MSDDDPTEWFRPRPGRDGDAAKDEPTPTEPMSAADAAEARGEADEPTGADQPTEALDADGLHDLFGPQQDHSGESDWLPSAPRSDDATAVHGTPATDPVAWLNNDGSETPSADPGAATAVFGAAGAGAAGGTAAGLGAAGLADDTTTRRFDATDATDPNGGGDEPPGSRRTVIILAIVGSVLLVAIVIGLIVLFSSRAATPSASRSASPSHSASASASPSSTPSSTPTATPTPTPTPAPPPAPPATIGAFSASPPAPKCTVPTGSVNVSFSWSTSNASKVGLSIDGVQDPYNDQLSPAGTLSNVPYDCSKASQGYTLTATNAKGVETSKQLTLVRPTIAPTTPSPDPGDGTGGGTGGGDDND